MVLIRDMTPRVTFPPPLGPACSLAARCRAHSLRRMFHVTCFCCGEGCLLAWGPSLVCTAPPTAPCGRGRCPEASSWPLCAAF